MRISDWSSDVCSSDLCWPRRGSLSKPSKGNYREAPVHLVAAVGPVALCPGVRLATVERTTGLPGRDPRPVHPGKTLARPAPAPHQTGPFRSAEHRVGKGGVSTG